MKNCGKKRSIFWSQKKVEICYVVSSVTCAYSRLHCSVLSRVQLWLLLLSVICKILSKWKQEKKLKKDCEKKTKKKNDKFLTGNNQRYPEWKMALEVYRIILLIGVFSVVCNGIIRAPVLDKVQKIAADDSSEISDNVKDHNLNRTQTCPQHCRCVWFENDSSFQSISCFLANVTQGRIIFCDFWRFKKLYVYKYWHPLCIT